ncbi:DUF4062 domain-containing protein [Oryzomonas rubra]|uniref:DUF4062 domain-containing protein n=1 Tax=Oryzomonas rubra TaxID=2509454 RepID=A0A5A9XS82_9BACT|nr:DUF4062 domain-containing protein [Oryzomonas rubra]KAA0895108.1 DUF4062 domain-containing protein [Oryzomonas rubra]
MATTMTILRLFVGSPGDVTHEREILEEIVRELNLVWSRQLGIYLELTKWETHAYPGVGTEPQAVINEQIGEDWDIFIGIMWTRFGTPTKNYGSGTEEEFEIGLRLFKESPRLKRVMFYFNNAPVSPSAVDIDQFRHVIQFKNKLGEKGSLYWEYHNEEEFSQLVRMHLSRQIQDWGNKWGEQQSEPMVPVVVAVVEEVANTSEDEGFLDLVEDGCEKFAAMTSVMASMTEAAMNLNEKVDEKNTDLLAANQAGDLKAIKRLTNSIAEDLDFFASLLEAETPIFAEALKNGINTMTKATNIVKEFITGDVSEIKNTLAGMRGFRDALIGAKSGNDSFYQQLESTPRMTTLMNHAKRRALKVMGSLSREIDMGINLMTELEKNLIDIIEQSEVILPHGGSADC